MDDLRSYRLQLLLQCFNEAAFCADSSECGLPKPVMMTKATVRVTLPYSMRLLGYTGQTFSGKRNAEFGVAWMEAIRAFAKEKGVTEIKFGGTYSVNEFGIASCPIAKIGFLNMNQPW